METLSRTLAKYVAGFRYEDLPADVVRMAKLAYLDWVGNALAGSAAPPARMARAVGKTMGKNDDALLFDPDDLRHWAPAAVAAFVNGVSTHILELDDVHKGSTMHAGTVVMPAALAACQRGRADGRRLIEAIVAGFDVAIRIGEAVNPSHYWFWHPTGTVATFGAAAAAGKVMGLEEEALVHAFGSAGTQAAGIWEFLADGAMSKHLHPGKAAMNGLLAADLAREGFTGASKIVEGTRGYALATSVNPDFTRITDGLGRHYKLLENCFKLHACCGHTHSAVDMALRLKSEHNLQPAQIRRVKVRTYKVAYDLVNNPNPVNVYQAKFSLQYTVAAALSYGKVGLAQFGDSFLQDLDLRALMGRVDLEIAPEIDSAYPAKWGTHLVASLEEGRTVEAASDYPLGNPENPVPAARLEQKFEELAGLVLPTAVVHRALSSYGDLENCPDTRLLPGGIWAL